MTNISSYPTPDELESMIDTLHISPEMEAWLVGAIMEYRMVARTIVGLVDEQRKEIVP